MDTRTAAEVGTIRRLAESFEIALRARNLSDRMVEGTSTRSASSASGSVVLFEADDRSRTRVSGSTDVEVHEHVQQTLSAQTSASGTSERACRVSLVLICNSSRDLR
jgi:hypothetical protein